jgi:hypothetical protein
MYETISSTQLDSLQNKQRDCKGTKYSDSFGQNAGIQNKLDRTLDKMQKYRRNWTGLWTKCRNTEETGQDFVQNVGKQKKLDRTLDKTQKYRRNWTGLWTKCRNTEETGHDFVQNVGIQKKLDRT